jgi:Na+/H+-dicarboxylate symporter
VRFRAPLHLSLKTLSRFHAIAPAQLLAFSTSSSAATLPVTMECVTENVGVDEEVSSFVLPLVTVNMDGTSLISSSSHFIAQQCFKSFRLKYALMIVVTATLASRLRSS